MKYGLSDSELGKLNHLLTTTRRGKALRRIALDAEPDLEDAPASITRASAIAGMLSLKADMSPEGFKALCMGLCDEEEAKDGEYVPGDPKNDLCRAPNGGAMDSAAKSFAERFPDAARIKGETPRVATRMAPVSAAVRNRFDAMFPDAANIKVSK